MAEVDDWQPAAAAGQDDWQPVAPQQPEAQADLGAWDMPDAFKARISKGHRLMKQLENYQRQTDLFDKAATEGWGQTTPTGFSDETLKQLTETGLFGDKPAQRINQTLMIPAAQAWQALQGFLGATSRGSAALLSDAMRSKNETPDEFEKRKNEFNEFINMGLISSGMEAPSLARPKVGAGRIDGQLIGTIPRDADFKTASDLLGGKFTESNLRRAWQEEGIHPAEIVHDQARDAFLKHQVTAEPRPVELDPDLFDTLIETGGPPPARSPQLVVARQLPDGQVKYGQPGQVHTDLMTRRELNSEGPTPPEVEKQMGFAQPGGQFMNRAEALDFAKKHEPERARFSLERPENGLEAATYNEASRHSLGAEVTTEPPPVPLDREPAAPPATFVTKFHAAAESLFDIGRDAQMLVAPMARGTTESMAIAKDFANNLRRNRWDWSRIDDDIAKRFNPEQRKRMWDAADEESVLRQEGKTSEHMGIATLTDEERAAVEDMNTRSQLTWMRLRDMGMVEGEGLPFYTPRMVLNMASAIDKEGPIPLNGMGHNLRTRTAQMLHRKYLTAEETEAAAKERTGQRLALQAKSLDEIEKGMEEVKIARDIRALPLATARLEDAIAGRTLINAIKDYGKRTGSETMVEGGIPAGATDKWFTIDHPSFRTWRPKFEEVDGKVTAVKDAEGNTIFEQVPIYVRGDFEGPLRSVLTEKNGAVYNAMMTLKGKTMSLIMNSPLIHNAVEWGRAIPAMPGKVTTFKVYFEGNRARKDVATMHEAIDAGMVPIGHRFFNQDISSIMEAPDLAPGRSWTAKVLGFVPGLFDEAAGAAVKRSIDKAGDFWHNTLLWDRVADLQAGLYTNFRDDLLAKGVDRQAAARAAAHWANRYAGALPQEAMSHAARKISNMLLFSRSFTMGNLGALKDVLTGLPKDVLAQIERDGGFRAGAIAGADTATAGEAAVSYAKSMARRKAMSIVALDMGLMYVGNSILQNVANVLFNDSTLDKEMHGYAERLSASLQERSEHPLKLLQPLDFLQSLSATAENEPGRQDRIRIGNAKDGTAIYARNPVGKIGEEFLGYLTGPLDMLRKKLGTVARPTWQVMANDAGFGRKVYDPDADTPEKYLANMGAIAKHFAGAQFPTGQFNALSDLVKGEGDSKVAALQAFGPFAGVTFAKGAPGGQGVGELYHARAQHDYAVQAALPDIRRQIQNGDVAGAQQRMNELGIPPGLQKFYVKTSLTPATRLGGRTLRDFYLYGTEEQKRRMERLQ